jgi:general L-amino acid transport system substrate-binding protein
MAAGGWRSLPSFRLSRGSEGAGHYQGRRGRIRQTRRHTADQLLGRDFATAQALGSTHDWGAKDIAATGNYGENFEHTAGKPYQLERGVNALWAQGGLMAPMPMK